MIGVVALGTALSPVACRQFPETTVNNDLERQGREIFRDDTFGDEKFWADTARLHEVVVQELHRGPVPQNGAR